MRSENKTIGVVIPTLNAGGMLKYCLSPFLKSPLKPRILLVDSSSTDGTPDIAKNLGIELISICRDEFNHGLTRENARKYINTDIVVMVTQDAIPVDETMMDKLVEPILKGDAVVSYGRQIPHEGAGFLELFDRYFNYPAESQLRGLHDEGKYGVFTFYCSNSWSAWLNSALDEVGGFPFILTLEDTIAAARLLRRGYQIAYVAESVVTHSHNFSLSQEFRRYFSIGYVRESHRELLFAKAKDEQRGFAYVKGMFRQLWPAKIFLLPSAIFHLGAKLLGYKLGQNSSRLLGVITLIKNGFKVIDKEETILRNKKPMNMAEISNKNSRPQRPRVLLLAAACNPYRGSDSAVGWGRAGEAAKRFDTWVICSQGDQEDICRYLSEHGEIPGLHFCYLEKSRIEEFLKRRRPLYDTHYLPYNLWQRRAFRFATRLHRALKFDLIHQVTRTGFREPGYLWKLEAPFIWGPVGGTQNYPWRFLKAAGFRGALKEGMRSLINVLQFRFSPRVRKALKRAKAIIAANAEIQHDFERVHGIRPEILLDIGVHGLKAVSAPRTLQNSPLRILWLGQLKHHKALHLLIQALALMPSGFSYEFRVLGKGPLKKRWQALAKRLGVDSHCQWPGWIPHELAMNEYDRADVLVFSSLRDTASNVVLEALSRGVPIICLDHQGVRDVVTDECGIKIPVTTPGEVIAQLRNHLVDLTTDRTKLESLSRGALKRASQYLWSRNGERMARIYSTVLQANQTNAAKEASLCGVERRTQGTR
jgi:rhamnosyltransferase